LYSILLATLPMRHFARQVYGARRRLKTPTVFCAAVGISLRDLFANNSSLLIILSGMFGSILLWLITCCAPFLRFVRVKWYAHEEKRFPYRWRPYDKCHLRNANIAMRTKRRFGWCRERLFLACPPPYASCCLSLLSLECGVTERCGDDQRDANANVTRWRRGRTTGGSSPLV